MSTEHLTGNAAMTMDLSHKLGQLLEQAGLTIATAESCTGGLVSGAVTDVAGSSAWFECGVVTYSNAAKHALLDVKQAVFEQHGAVSEACVKAMAKGALRKFGVDVAISVSGIAGPGGASPGKPVGTVWIGWALRCAAASEGDESAKPITSEAIVEAIEFCFSGDRLQVREQAVHEALRGTISRIENTGI